MITAIIKPNVGPIRRPPLWIGNCETPAIFGVSFAALAKPGAEWDE
jgi:hypothetical protein